MKEKKDQRGVHEDSGENRSSDASISHVPQLSRPFQQYPAIHRASKQVRFQSLYHVYTRRTHINMRQRKSSSLIDEPLELLFCLSSLRCSLKEVVPNSTSSAIEERGSDDDPVDAGGREDVVFGFDARNHHVSGLGVLSSFVGKSMDERGGRLRAVCPAVMTGKSGR